MVVLAADLLPNHRLRCDIHDLGSRQGRRGRGDGRSGPFDWARVAGRTSVGGIEPLQAGHERRRWFDAPITKPAASRDRRKGTVGRVQATGPGRGHQFLGSRDSARPGRAPSPLSTDPAFHVLGDRGCRAEGSPRAGPLGRLGMARVLRIRRAPAVEQLVKEHAQAVDVTPLVGRVALAVGLLGAHVGGSAQDGPVAGQVRVDLFVASPGRNQSGEAAPLVQQHVVRLHVAMGNAAAVRIVERMEGRGRSGPAAVRSIRRCSRASDSTGPLMYSIGDPALARRRARRRAPRRCSGGPAGPPPGPRGRTAASPARPGPSFRIFRRRRGRAGGRTPGRPGRTRRCPATRGAGTVPATRASRAPSS